MEELIKQLIGNVITELEPRLRMIVREEIDKAKVGSQNPKYDKPYLALKDAADFCTLSKNAFIAATIENQIRKYKIGRKNYYAVADLNSLYQ